MMGAASASAPERLAAIHGAVDAVLRTSTDPAWRRKLCLHLYGVSQCAALLALARGEDAELAAISGMLHDLSVIQAGNYVDHCQLSAAAARTLMDETGLFSAAEIDSVCQAIVRHDGRAEVDAPLDEVLKDADILHPYLHSLEPPRNATTMHRLDSMRTELGL